MRKYRYNDEKYGISYIMWFRFVNNLLASALLALCLASANADDLNSFRIANGELETGLIQTDVSYIAYTATEIFADSHPQTHPRIIASFYREKRLLK